MGKTRNHKHVPVIGLARAKQNHTDSPTHRKVTVT